MHINSAAVQPFFSTFLEAHDAGDYVTVTCHGPDGTKFVVGMPLRVWLEFVRATAATWLTPEGVNKRTLM